MTSPAQLRRTATAASAVALLALAVAVGATSAAAPRAHVAVFFTQGEQLVRVTRPGATPADALHQLVAGLTSTEVKRGLRTYVPAGTKVRSVKVLGRLATVDVGRRFVSGRDTQSLLARLSQLVRTLTGLQGITKVQLLVDGATVSGVFPGVRTTSPITFRYLQTPNVPVPTHRNRSSSRPTSTYGAFSSG